MIILFIFLEAVSLVFFGVPNKSECEAWKDGRVFGLVE